MKHHTLNDVARSHEAVGRLKEGYPRVARYHELRCDETQNRLSIEERHDRRSKAEVLDGTYILRTDRPDIGDEEIWRTYILLTRTGNSFRCMKSPLWKRAIFHHLERRVPTHVFLCVPAYHLLVAIEKRFLDNGELTSWETIRQALLSHQIDTVALPCTDGRTLCTRRATKPEQRPASTSTTSWQRIRGSARQEEHGPGPKTRMQ